MTMVLQTERDRQRSLLAALRPGAPDTPPAGARLAGDAADGLRAYRVNARAIAVRALAAAFPTVAAMLGEAAFAAVARDHWRDAPPERGDLGEWGGALPAWLAGQRSLMDWPWLADCARLDCALHCCERAADAELDAASLQSLADTDPASLRLVLRPGCTLIDSRWPLATLHATHRRGDDVAFAEARAALSAGQGEAVLVARDGWRAAVHPVDVPTVAWLRAVLAGDDLASALDAAGPGFDFGAWLAQALAAGWLQGLRAIRD